MSTLAPLYVLVMLCSVALISFNLGKKACQAPIEYRFIPRTQQEAEEHVGAGAVLGDLIGTSP